MDYEKAYKAVLKTATQWIKDGCTDKEKVCLECVFPELRESEDERMMREFNDWLCEEIECLTNDLRDEKDRRTLNILCYVLKKFKDRPEKQKESLHISESCKENADSFTSEQKPEEWSEEDERMLSRCEKSIESSKQFADSDTFKKAKDNEIDWLENRFKSLRPSWKPSEKQMNCLCAAVDAAIRKHNESVSGYEPAKVLKSLYEDLQKLM